VTLACNVTSSILHASISLRQCADTAESATLNLAGISLSVLPAHPRAPSPPPLFLSHTHARARARTHFVCSPSPPPIPPLLSPLPLYHRSFSPHLASSSLLPLRGSEPPYGTRMSPTAQSLLRAPRIPLPLMALAQQRPVPGDSGASELEAPGLTAAWVWTQAVWSEKLHARESADGFVSIHVPPPSRCTLALSLGLAPSTLTHFSQ